MTAAAYVSGPYSPGRMRALAVLAHGRSSKRPVTETNMTTSAARWALMPLFVHWKAVNWLAEGGLVSTTLVQGERIVELTDAGVELVEQLDLT